MFGVRKKLGSRSLADCVIYSDKRCKKMIDIAGSFLKCAQVMRIHVENFEELAPQVEHRKLRIEADLWAFFRRHERG